MLDDGFLTKIIIIVCVIFCMLWFSNDFKSNPANHRKTEQRDETRKKEKKSGKTAEKIKKAKAELDKIKESRSKDGKPGKLKWTDATKPEVVLPPLLALVEDDLKYYDLDKAKLIEEIKAHPEKFRRKVPEHWRKRFLILTSEYEKKILE